jgi:hypothetical protein
MSNNERVRRAPERPLMLDPGRTALALRGLQNPDGCYPFIDRRWRVRTRRWRPGQSGIARRALSGVRAWLSGSHRAWPASIPGTSSAR